MRHHPSLTLEAGDLLLVGPGALHHLFVRAVASHPLIGRAAKGRDWLCGLSGVLETASAMFQWRAPCALLLPRHWQRSCCGASVRLQLPELGCSF